MRKTISIAALLFLQLAGPIAVINGQEAVPPSWPDSVLFAKPTDPYGVEAIWQWLNGSVSKEGITKDLQAMHDQGISRAMLHITCMGPSGAARPLLSDAWYDCWRHTVAEANRIGIKFNTHIASGWSESGGPWIKPENSMKRVVWSHQFVEGGHLVELDLPPLPELKNWSKEIAILAWPVKHQPSRMEGCTVQSNGKPIDARLLFDGNPTTGADSEDPSKWRLDFAFPTPHACDRAHFFIRWKEHEPMPNKIQVRVLADGKLIQETEIDSQKLFGDLDIPFPAIESTQISIEFQFLKSIQLTPWATFRQVKLAEVELFSGSEVSQWVCEMQNLAQQTDDSGNPGMSNWSSAESHPIQVNQVLDLSSQCKNGHLSWNAPAGKWRVVRFGFTTTGQTCSVPLPCKEGIGLETDKMSVTATDLHFKSYVEPLINAIPKEQRSAFDQIQLDSWEAGRQNWTDDFASEFSQRRGYAITSYLPVLAGEVIESRSVTDRFLNDFRETISKLIAERFYGRNAQLLHEQGMKFVAEISEKDIPFMDIFPLARCVDLPEDEFWSDNYDGSLLPIPDASPRDTMVPEAAYVAGKTVVEVEAFTSNRAAFDRTPGDYGYLGDDALLWGYNRMVLHSFPHQPTDKGPGLTLGQHGQLFDRLNTWWPMIGGWIREISRAQYLLQTSFPVYDVLVYDGDSMPRPQTRPLGGLPAGIRQLRMDRVALHQLKVINGLLTLNGTDRFQALIVPSNRLHADTVETLARLLNEGAVIAAPRPGPAPGLSQHEEQDRRIEMVANQIWGPTGAPATLPQSVGKGKIYAIKDLNRLFSESGIHSDFISLPLDGVKPLMTQHRRNGATDLYGLFNPNEKVGTYTCTVAVDVDRVPEIWNPLTGKHLVLGAHKRENGKVTFPLTVEAHRTLYLLLSTSTGIAVPPAANHSSESSKTFVIQTPFSVVFKGLPSLPPQSIQPPASWTDQINSPIRDYSGIAAYQTQFTLPPDFPTTGPVVLDLGDVVKVARVILNGQEVGILWRSPWRLDVGSFLRPGSNTLEIEVANTWKNRLLGDSKLPDSEKTTFTTWPLLKSWLAQVTPEKSGLLGEIKLQSKPSSATQYNP